jgi:hypothetical protein
MAVLPVPNTSEVAFASTYGNLILPNTSDSFVYSQPDAYVDAIIDQSSIQPSNSISVSS